MTAVIALVILTGAACSSPVEQAERTTVAYQVPCALVIREPTANPFKIAQASNAVSVDKPKAVPKYTYAPKKKPKKRKKARR